MSRATENPTLDMLDEPGAYFAFTPLPGSPAFATEFLMELDYEMEEEYTLRYPAPHSPQNVSRQEAQYIVDERHGLYAVAHVPA